jgi:hypothetical protein
VRKVVRTKKKARSSFITLFYVTNIAVTQVEDAPSQLRRTSNVRPFYWLIYFLSVAYESSSNTARIVGGRTTTYSSLEQRILPLCDRCPLRLVQRVERAQAAAGRTTMFFNPALKIRPRLDLPQSRRAPRVESVHRAPLLGE